MLENKKKQLTVPIEHREFLAIYSTLIEDTLLFDCITAEYIQKARESIQLYDEQEIESIFESEDTSAHIAFSRKCLAKFRKLDKSIGEQLKEVYDNRCQICGIHVGERYDTRVIHAHHIDYFSKSLNNNASNIMIVCPNHHGVIHAAKPEFDRSRYTFHYSNGYTDKLLLNKHL